MQAWDPRKAMTTEKEVKVIIVGAGLVGALAAIYMSRLGYEVQVYEKRKGKGSLGGDG